MNFRRIFRYIVDLRGGGTLNIIPVCLFSGLLKCAGRAEPAAEGGDHRTRLYAAASAEASGAAG